MKARVILSLVIAILFSLGFTEPILSTPMNSAPASTDTNKANYTILGLVVGESRGYQVHSKFGFALAFGDDHDPEARQLCLVSDRDESLLLLRLKHNRLIQLRLQSNKKHFYKWHFCSKSALVSKYTATDGGIRLGMSKTDLKSILGLPEEESNSRMKYIWQKSTNKTNSRNNQQIEFLADFYNGILVEIDIRWKTD